MIRIPRLFRKPLLHLLVIFGLIATVTSATNGYRLNRELNREYESKAELLARSVAESDLQLLLEGDAAALQSRIDQYLDIEGVGYVLVTDEGLNILAHTFAPKVPGVVRDIVGQRQPNGADDRFVTRDITLESGDMLHAAYPILDGLAGHVHIGMDKGIILERIQESVLEQQFITLLLFVGTGLTTLLFIQSISRPIRRLSAYAKRVASHDFTAVPEVDSPDELGDLANSMRSMAHDIDGLISNLEERVRIKTMQLHEANEELEGKVLERTAEIARANTQLKIEIAERRAIGEALRRAEVKYRSIFENSLEGIYQLAENGRLLSANPAMAKLFGFPDIDAMMGTVQNFNEDYFTDIAARTQFLQMVRDLGEAGGNEVLAKRRDGQLIWVKESIRAVSDDEGRFLYFEGSFSDISLRKRAEQELKRQAFHDSLTGLPNRALFLDHLGLALQRAKRREYLFAVLYLDLDRFKVINDSLGHAVGDELLKGVARNLMKSARSMDTVARFGGDEFAILLEEITAPKDAIVIARRILESFGEPFTIRGQEVFTSTSIGIVMNTGEYSNPEAVLRDADTAMYRAKETGKSRFKVFSRKMHDQALKIMELETDMRRAVEARDFTVAYQPIVCLRDDRVSGFEALVRWTHPERGPISPADFIPLAEDTGMVYDIDQFVLEHACSTLKRWQETILADRDDDMITLNLNLSGKHFGQTFLIRSVPETLRRMDVDPAWLNLEITESALMEQPVLAQEMLQQLKNLGLGLCIDDFGTGYSSLSYLQRFPIDIVKIDRSFIANVDRDADSRAIVKTIFNLGKSLGLKVVAEGVETPEQLEFLREMGCRYVQGYHFYKPLTEPEVEAMFRRDSFTSCTVED